MEVKSKLDIFKDIIFFIIKFSNNINAYRILKDGFKSKDDKEILNVLLELMNTSSLVDNFDDLNKYIKDNFKPKYINDFDGINTFIYLNKIPQFKIDSIFESFINKGFCIVIEKDIEDKYIKDLFIDTVKIIYDEYLNEDEKEEFKIPYESFLKEVEDYKLKLLYEVI